jgi:hypothetical protein
MKFQAVEKLGHLFGLVSSHKLIDSALQFGLQDAAAINIFV